MALVSRYRLTARSAAAAKVLALCDDERSSAENLADAIGTDPLLAATMLRIANSAYYGLSGRVGTLSFAVSVMGFQGVRSLAVISAAGLDTVGGAPPGFWEAAALCATGAELVAPIVGADPGDAFIVGLLHLVGAALMHQQGERVTICLPESHHLDEQRADELAQHGVTHDALAAVAMEHWHFPPRIHEVIGRHHLPLTPDALPLERTLHVARSLAGDVLCTDCPSDEGYAWLSEGLISPSVGESLMVQMQERSAALLDGLRPT